VQPGTKSSGEIRGRPGAPINVELQEHIDGLLSLPVRKWTITVRSDYIQCRLDPRVVAVIELLTGLD